jgi:ATP phosphoribosyltransferase regulatory subunit
MMGLRADTTPQVARIDAHLLNRQGVTAVLLRAGAAHPPDRPHATREPLQFGAEIYGHAGLEADLEALLLALDCLKAAGVGPQCGHGRRAHRAFSLLAGVPLDARSAGTCACRAGRQGRSELASLTTQLSRRRCAKA